MEQSDQRKSPIEVIDLKFIKKLVRPHLSSDQFKKFEKKREKNIDLKIISDELIRQYRERRKNSKHLMETISHFQRKAESYKDQVSYSKGQVESLRKENEELKKKYAFIKSWVKEEDKGLYRNLQNDYDNEFKTFCGL